MGEIGDGSGSSYPASVDTNSSPEVDDVTVARAAVPNDLAAAIIAVENELGPNPRGSTADVKTFLQTEHNTDGTHGTIETVTIGSGVTFAGAGWPSFRVGLDGDQTVASGTGTPKLVKFENELFDNSGTPDMFDDSAGQYKFSSTQAGKFYFRAQLVLKSLTNGKLVNIFIKNQNVTEVQFTEHNDSGSPRDQYVRVACILDIDGDQDFIQVYMTHDGTGSLDIDSDTTKTFFTGTRVG